MGARARCPPGCGARIGALWTLFSGSRTTATGEPYPRVTRIDRCLAPGTIVHAEYRGHRFARDFGAPPLGGTVPCECEAVIQSPAAICKDCIREGSEGS